MLSVLDRLRATTEKLEADEGLILEREDVAVVTTNVLTQGIDQARDSASLKLVLNSLLAFVEDALTTDIVPIVLNRPGFCGGRLV